MIKYVRIKPAKSGRRGTENVILDNLEIQIFKILRSAVAMGGGASWKSAHPPQLHQDSYALGSLV